MLESDDLKETATIGTRLRQWRKSISMKGYQLCKIIKISQGSLSDIENNKSHPAALTLAKIHKHTNVNILWLLVNEGPMLKTGDGGTQSSVPLIDPIYSELLKKFEMVYFAGDDKEKARLIGFLLGISDR